MSGDAILVSVACSSLWRKTCRGRGGQEGKGRSERERGFLTASVRNWSKTLFFSTFWIESHKEVGGLIAVRTILHPSQLLIGSELVEAFWENRENSGFSLPFPSRETRRKVLGDFSVLLSS